LCADIRKRGLLSAGDCLKNPALPVRKIVSDAERRHIAAREETNAYCPGYFQELRLGMACTET
jgi:hypothetical protein